MLRLFREAKLGVGKVLLLMLFIGLQIAGTLYLPRLTANIINNGVMLGDTNYVLTTGALMLGVAVLTGIAAVLGTFYSAWVSTLFARNTRMRLYAHTGKLSYQDFRHFSTSSLITRATNDIEQMQSTIGMFFQMLLPAPFVVVVGLILSFRSDSYMALILLIVSIIMMIFFGAVALWAYPIFGKVQKGLDKINDRVAQYISGIRVVRAFNRTKLERQRMDGAFQDFAKLNIKLNRVFAAMMPMVTFFMSVCIVAVVWFGGIRVDSGHMLIGDITAVIEYAMNILFYLIMAVFVMIFLPRSIVCAGRVNEVLSYNPEIKDGESNLKTKTTSLVFNNVDFRYTDAENPVLFNLNFECKIGTTTAIIGGTGSGKSTIARLIPRLIDTTIGKITINGMDIKEIPQEELRQRVGFVPQKAFLFGGTIKDNLLHGDPNATNDDLTKAAEIAQAADFINELEEKFDASVVQGGKNFSGGQKQRLAIARMLVKKPDIYVFDDSFSALDFKTDAALRSALKETTKDSIVITVAQRVTTIKDADQILVVDEGKIVGIGTHEELLKNNEIYLEIAKSQLSEEELERELKGERGQS